jgi:hypothetical protein
MVTDNAGYNSMINIATANNITLYTAPPGSTIKGIAFVPSPSATIDSDGDGYTDLQEFLAGTDPHDPTSCLHVSAVSRDQNGYHITFASVPGKKYRVERSNTPSATNQWDIVADNLVAAGSSITVLDTPPSSPNHWFYRVVLIP